MRVRALKDFKLKTTSGDFQIKLGEELKIFDETKGKVLLAKGYVELVMPELITDPVTAERIKAFGCKKCPWFTDGQACVVDSSDCFHVVPIRALRACPRKDRKIFKAIERGQHLVWLH